MEKVIITGNGSPFTPDELKQIIGSISEQVGRELTVDEVDFVVDQVSTKIQDELDKAILFGTGNEEEVSSLLGTEQYMTAQVAIEEIEARDRFAESYMRHTRPDKTVHTIDRVTIDRKDVSVPRRLIKGE